MTSEKKCARCEEPARTIDNLDDSTFWGLVVATTETVVTKSVRLMATYLRGRSDITRADEEKPLCSPCWSLLIGQFMQGRAVAPVVHEHEWKRGGRLGGYPMKRCNLCMQDRIAETYKEAHG